MIVAAVVVAVVVDVVVVAGLMMPTAGNIPVDSVNVLMSATEKKKERHLL